VSRDLSEIAVGPDGISWKTGTGKAAKYPSLGFAKDKWDAVAIARLLVERNRQALVTAGWTAEIGDEKVVLKKS
jgi:hypothetical protein